MRSRSPTTGRERRRTLDDLGAVGGPRGNTVRSRRRIRGRGMALLRQARTRPGHHGCEHHPGHGSDHDQPPDERSGAHDVSSTAAFDRSGVRDGGTHGPASPRCLRARPTRSVARGRTTADPAALDRTRVMGRWVGPDRSRWSRRAATRWSAAGRRAPVARPCRPPACGWARGWSSRRPRWRSCRRPAPDGARGAPSACRARSSS